MKLLRVLLLTMVLSIAIQAKEYSWPKDQSFTQWARGIRLKVDATDKLLTLSNMKKDSYVIANKLNLTPQLYNRIVIEYRATNINKSSLGQFYYITKGKKTFSDKYKFVFSGIISDNSWRKLIITANNLIDADSWLKGQNIIALRLDITDAPGTKIEIREIKLDNKAKFKKKYIKYPIIKSSIPSKIKNVPLHNFKGGFMRAKADTPGTKKANMPKSFSLRRIIDVPKDLDFAYIQFTADDNVDLWLNGTFVAKRNFYNAWKSTSIINVTKYLKIGKKNVLVFDYNNYGDGGGVIMEMLLSRKNGSVKILTTNDNFVATVNHPKGRHNIDYDHSSWEKAIVQGVPPFGKWRQSIPYVNFNCFQKVIEQKGPTKKEYNANENINLKYVIEGKIPKLPLYGFINIVNPDGVELYEKYINFTSMVKKINSNQWEINFAYKLPQYLSSSQMKLKLKFNSLFIANDKSIKFQYNERKVNKVLNAKVVRDINGTPQLSLNGKLQYAILGNIGYRLMQFDVSGFSKMPMNLRSVSVDENNRIWWTDVEQYDFTKVDWVANKVLEENPNCKLIMWLTCRPPYWFGRRFPTQLLKFQDDKYSNKRFPSFSSDISLNVISKAVKAYINHVQNSPYRDKVAGYAINNGETIEWLGWYFSRNYRLSRLSDYSKINQTKFADFVANNYSILGEKKSIPSAKERIQKSDDNSLILTPEKNLSVIAYNDFHSKQIVKVLLHLGRVARKELKGDNKILGCYYGYPLELPNMIGGVQLGGHQHLENVLNANIFNFIMSPQSYQMRGIGEPFADMKPFKTLANRGILSMLDDDTRTHTTPWRNFAQTVNAKQSQMVMRRNHSTNICRLQPIDILALGYGNEFNSPELIEDLKVIKKVGDFSVKNNVSRNAQIAVVVSEDSLKYLPMTTRLHRNGERRLRYNIKGEPINHFVSNSFGGEAISWQRKVLSEIGAEVDYLLAEDLVNSSKKYKLYIFLNQWSYDDKFLKEVKKLQQIDTMLLWMYAPVNTEEETKVLTNPLDELNSNIEDFRNRLKILLEESTALIRKVKEVSIQHKQKEREFVQARRAIERIKMAI